MRRDTNRSGEVTMGAIVRRYFDEAERTGGIVGKMRLASMTRVTSTQAVAIEDSPEIVARFEDAMARLQREFSDKGAREGQLAPARTPSVRPADETQWLRKRLGTIQELLSQRLVFLGDVVETSRRVTESAASCLDIERVSIWLLDDKATKISCVDLFVRSTREHSSGVELHAKDFPSYFDALERERTISANDAHQDPRTSCFSEVYLKPLGIGALLDVPIWADGKMVGVVCHEHIGGVRTFTADDEVFASAVGSLVALSLERVRRV